ncbi:MAG: DUF885 domain-containing protein [Caulobacterales bacterium]
MSLDRRSLLVTAAAAGLAATARAAPKAPAGPPGDAAINRYFDVLCEHILAASPETATSLGLDTGARAALKSRLSDASMAHVAADRAWCRQNLTRLEAFPDAGLSPTARLNKAVMKYAFEIGRDAAPFDYGENTLNSAMSEAASPYVVSQQSGAYSSVPEFLDSQHKVATRADAEAYLARVHAMARVLKEETERVRKDAGLGVVAPDFILSNAIGQQEGLLAIPAAKARLATALGRKVRDAKLAGDYQSRCAAIVEKEVYPALAAQLATLKGLRAKAGHDAGVWRLPNGDAYYRWLLREGTTTTLSPEEVHNMGLEQNKAIEARMDGLLKAQGLTQGSVGERMTALGKDPKYLFPNTDAGREQIIAYLNGLIAAVRPRLDRAFTLKLKAPVLVKRVPVDIQDGAGQGYMNTGSMDGSRPSTYYINLKSTENWPKFSLPSLTYHETIPGHAWQGAYLTETGKLPLIRVLMSGFNAYVEGYALYAEQLGDEIGMYDDDWAGRLGYLQAQKFRAVRLVVDTGLHAKRWSREQAIQWAVDNSGRTREAMTSEIDRYCGTPAQACGYKVGHTEINRLRDRAKAGLGGKYDLRIFDDLVVKTGAVPLTVLSDVVDGYIKAGGVVNL